MMVTQSCSNRTADKLLSRDIPHYARRCPFLRFRNVTGPLAVDKRKKGSQSTVTVSTLEAVSVGKD
jgi:hypothetical protein